MSVQDPPRWWPAALLALAVGGCGPGDGEARAAERSDRGLEARPGPTPVARRDVRPPQELPEGVTGEMVARGEAVYEGVGFCYTCHGAEGRGVAGLGADLTDGAWRHTDGSYEGIAARVRAGVTAEASDVGVPMPPRGGGRLSDEQVRAVAAYVWVLSRRGR